MSIAVRRALYGRMAADTTLVNLLGTAPGSGQNIWYQLAPQSAVFPYVIFSKQSGNPSEVFDGLPDEGTWGTGRVLAGGVDIWLIKGVGRETSADDAEGIANRLLWLFDGATGTDLSISGGTLVHLHRQSDVDYGEVDEGVQYHHAGSLYRLVYQ